MRESSPMPVSRRPIAITTAKHYETSIPFLLWLFGTPLVVLVQFFMPLTNQNHANLVAQQWHRYEIEVNNQDYIVRLNGFEATRFQRSPTDMTRGKPPSVDPNSGFIGLQTHTGAVAFANIRIKT